MNIHGKLYRNPTPWATCAKTMWAQMQPLCDFSLGTAIYILFLRLCLFDHFFSPEQTCLCSGGRRDAAQAVFMLIRRHGAHFHKKLLKNPLKTFYCKGRAIFNTPWPLWLCGDPLPHWLHAHRAVCQRSSLSSILGFAKYPCSVHDSFFFHDSFVPKVFQGVFLFGQMVARLQWLRHGI